jgi:hypothetical protein
MEARKPLRIERLSFDRKRSWSFLLTSSAAAVMETRTLTFQSGMHSKGWKRRSGGMVTTFRERLTSSWTFLEQA